MHRQIVFYIGDLPFASFSFDCCPYVSLSDFSGAVDFLEKVFVDRHITCAIRSDEGYLFITKNGLLTEKEKEELNDNRRSKESPSP